MRPPQALSATACSSLAPTAWHNSRKSLMLQKWMFGVALDHRVPLGHAFIDALARQLDAAAIDAAGFQKPQQFAVAAADVEHARAVLHHVGNHQQVDAGPAWAARGLGHGEIVFETRQHAHFPFSPLPSGSGSDYQRVRPEVAGPMTSSAIRVRGFGPCKSFSLGPRHPTLFPMGRGST